MKSPSPLELLLYLNSLGNVVPLTPFLHPKKTLQELESFESQWQPYNRHKVGYSRWGLSITSLDGGMSGEPDLYSLKDYNHRNHTEYREDDFKTFTPAYHASEELKKAIAPLGSVGRSHLLRLGRGGFFPPHRDNALLEPECFRILSCLETVQEKYSFVLDDRQYFFDAGVLYLVNTTLAHSLTSFHDHSHFLILNIPLNIENVEKVNDLLTQN